ncbi:hypothetical protein CC85DRAFT_208138 [Cutaneotrichosporon oleaginosum]|uniref:Uncharacterized protein n=1 Tax=Cutaneotrichosporon oleaginosum TaxID=879819 RepID=A0A0J0XDD0_9TREE|nr:uncharacterized protein CC85DRAFT_208138 [Cutaneotrichosporon oleaginosum]KLT39086.1 hypothetical protein CC85DRAFT_208138 [Cutaneotrichosporon oleaginosum]TXT08508.1 hypothetical protein COLE_05432 [Cutaneotrichosporon oleaginosum]
MLSTSLGRCREEYEILGARPPTTSASRDGALAFDSTDASGRRSAIRDRLLHTKARSHGLPSMSGCSSAVAERPRFQSPGGPAGLGRDPRHVRLGSSLASIRQAEWRRGDRARLCGALSSMSISWQACERQFPSPSVAQSCPCPTAGRSRHAHATVTVSDDVTAPHHFPQQHLLELMDIHRRVACF